jgi:hypothetical protein
MSDKTSELIRNINQSGDAHEHEEEILDFVVGYRLRKDHNSYVGFRVGQSRKIADGASSFFYKISPDIDVLEAIPAALDVESDLFDCKSIDGFIGYEVKRGPLTKNRLYKALGQAQCYLTRPAGRPAELKDPLEPDSVSNTVDFTEKSFVKYSYIVTPEPSGHSDEPSEPWMMSFESALELSNVGWITISTDPTQLMIRVEAIENPQYTESAYALVYAKLDEDKKKKAEPSDERRLPTRDLETEAERLLDKYEF